MMIICAATLSAQMQDTTTGMGWIGNMKWEQIIEKARTENKYIFIDCVASWCLPCKWMDANVYNEEAVITHFRNDFISVKLQFDTLKHPDTSTKMLYQLSKVFKDSYHVNMFPTFLFFSPDGIILHKDVGVKTKTDLINSSINSRNPEKQYYTLLRNYNMGKRDVKDMAYISYHAKAIDEKETAQKVSKDYIKNHLIILQDLNSFTKENVKFISTFVANASDPGFLVFYKNVAKVDSAMGENGYAKKVIDRLTFSEYIFPSFKTCDKTNCTPNWKIIYRKIKTKLDANTAKRNVVNSQLKWYSYKENWLLAYKYLNLKIKYYGIDTTDAMTDMQLNNIIWNAVFLNSKDQNAINNSIRWMENVISRNPRITNYLDTYSNLLYKIGRIKEAISIQQKALQLEPNNKDLIVTLEKMRAGKPTWIVSQL